MKKLIGFIATILLLSSFGTAQTAKVVTRSKQSKATLATAPLKTAATVITATSLPSATQHSVVLSWQDTDTSVLSYNVYRGSAAGQETLYASGVTVTSFTDATVVNGQTYFYVATAVGAGGESGPSNEVSVVIPSPPAAPSNLTATVH